MVKLRVNWAQGEKSQARYIMTQKNDTEDDEAFVSCMCAVATGQEIWLGQSCGVSGFLRYVLGAHVGGLTSGSPGRSREAPC